MSLSLVLLAVSSLDVTINRTRVINLVFPRFWHKIVSLKSASEHYVVLEDHPILLFTTPFSLVMRLC